jgi:hypothetical protein
MRIRLIAAAAALVLAAAGCGGGGPSSRDLVASYIDRVNAVQVKLVQPTKAVSDAGRELAKPKADRAAAERKLRRAALRIDALRKQLAAIAVPAEARKLRSMLIDRMQRQAALAREAAALVAFVPAFQAALQPLAAAGSELKAALTRGTASDVEAAALDTYAATLDTALGQLRHVEPPPVSAAEYATQVQTLERVRAAATALARALREQRADDLPRLLRSFQQAALGNQSLAAQRARIAAVRAYNERVRSLDQLAARIDKERLRLQQLLA